MRDDAAIIEVAPDNVAAFGFCAYTNPQKDQYKRKLEWFTDCLAQGLRYKVAYSNKDRIAAGMIEYIPGEYTWRSVDAKTYMVIHCIQVMKKYSGNGYASLLIQDCINDARRHGMDGVAALATKKTWCSDERIYLKNGFEVIERAPLGFRLLAKRLRGAVLPSFGDLEQKAERYKQGIHMFYSKQCPFMSTGEVLHRRKELLKSRYGVEAAIVEIGNSQEAQANPCAWGTYGMVANGKVISYVPGGWKSFVGNLQKAGLIGVPGEGR